jgi:hypothetical protein
VLNIALPPKDLTSKRTMISSAPRSLFLGTALVLPLAFASPAAADDAVIAKALFESGVEQMKAERYAKACPAIAESQRLDPHMGTLFTLAVCEQRWGHIGSAVAHFTTYLSRYDELSRAEQAQQRERPEAAKKQLDALIPVVPAITLVLPPSGLPPGTVVKRDGVILAEASLKSALPVDPGEHIITTQTPDGSAWEGRVILGTGEKKTLTLKLKSTSAHEETSPPNVEQPPKVDPSTQRVAAYVVGSAGLVGLTFGAVTGGLTFAQKSVVSSNCGSAAGFSDATQCNQVGVDAVKSGRAMGLVSTIAICAGSVGIGVGVALLLTEPARSHAAMGTASTRVPKWSMSAGVLDAGPAGAVIGVRGGW